MRSCILLPKEKRTGSKIKISSEWVAYLSHSQGMQELANMLLGSASGNTSASEDPFASGNGDPSSSENPNDEDRGTGNGGDLWA
ncbi:hypothetical protein Tco_0228461 [Tanacetum coccineum]